MSYLSKAFTRPKSFLLFLQFSDVTSGRIFGIKFYKDAKELLFSPAVDENLGVVLYRVCEDPERSS